MRLLRAMKRVNGEVQNTEKRTGINGEVQKKIQKKRRNDFQDEDANMTQLEMRVAMTLRMS